MKWCFLVVGLTVVGCDNNDVESAGGDVTINNNKCPSEEGDVVLSDAGASKDLPGVVSTCDDHLPCTVDVQCTPCSQVPEEIRYVKATCTPDNLLSPFCFWGDDIATRQLVYTGCTHFIADETPDGVKNACFPVRWPNDPKSEVHAGVCNAYGVCVDQ